MFATGGSGGRFPNQYLGRVGPPDVGPLEEDILVEDPLEEDILVEDP